jgi:hypothetical protein
VAAQLADTFDGYLKLLRESSLIRVDARGQLLCLRNAKTPRARWELANTATADLRNLPALPNVRAALDALQRDLDSEPPIEHRLQLIGMMLDVQGITPDLAYVQFLAWKLGECPKRTTETKERGNP